MVRVVVHRENRIAITVLAHYVMTTVVYHECKSIRPCCVITLLPGKHDCVRGRPSSFVRLSCHGTRSRRTGSRLRRRTRNSSRSLSQRRFWRLRLRRRLRLRSSRRRIISSRRRPYSPTCGSPTCSAGSVDTASPAAVEALELTETTMRASEVDKRRFRFLHAPTARAPRLIRTVRKVALHDGIVVLRFRRRRVAERKRMVWSHDGT